MTYHSHWHMRKVQAHTSYEKIPLIPHTNYIDYSHLPDHHTEPHEHKQVHNTNPLYSVYSMVYNNSYDHIS